MFLERPNVNRGHGASFGKPLRFPTALRAALRLVRTGRRSPVVLQKSVEYIVSQKSVAQGCITRVKKSRRRVSSNSLLQKFKSVLEECQS